LAKYFFEVLSGKITGHTEEEDVIVPESVVVCYESLYFPVKTFCFSVKPPMPEVIYNLLFVLAQHFYNAHQFSD
jgi:hypothetical protein